MNPTLSGPATAGISEQGLTKALDGLNEVSNDNFYNSIYLEKIDRFSSNQTASLLFFFSFNICLIPS